MKTLLEIAKENGADTDRNHYSFEFTPTQLKATFDDYCKQFEPVGEVYLELNTNTGGYNTFTTLFIDLPDKTKLFTTPQQIPSEVKAYIERLESALKAVRDIRVYKPDCLKD